MKPIQDEFTHLAGTVSRQWIAQLRWQRDGRCVTCGKPQHPLSAKFCERHALKCRVYQRNRFGYKSCKDGMHRGFDRNVQGLPVAI